MAPSDFSVLQNELKDRSTKIVMVAFDLLYLNGRDLRRLPLYMRKAVLKKIIEYRAKSSEGKGRLRSSRDCGRIYDPALYRARCRIAAGTSRYENGSAFVRRRTDAP